MFVTGSNVLLRKCVRAIVRMYAFAFLSSIFLFIRSCILYFKFLVGLPNPISHRSDNLAYLRIMRISLFIVYATHNTRIHHTVDANCLERKPLHTCTYTRLPTTKNKLVEKMESTTTPIPPVHTSSLELQIHLNNNYALQYNSTEETRYTSGM